MSKSHLIRARQISTDRSRLLLLTNSLQVGPGGGREKLCKLNYEALKIIYGDGFSIFEIDKKPVRGVASVPALFQGLLDGLSRTTFQSILKLIQEKKIDRVFIDGSNLGAIAAVIKREFPQVIVSTFFHNVESRFFYGAFKQRPSLRTAGVLVANYVAERKAVVNSDQLISLSKRDSALLEKIFGRSTSAIAPMVMQDELSQADIFGGRRNIQKFALFVGGTFYANIEGMQWFAKNVSRNIGIKTCIVGKGFEHLRSELEIDGRVEVIGAVEELGPWYRDAEFVVAPIFDGSGMKTKVAEALMFGKRIIGTPEAFSGYEHIADRVGWVCSSATEFKSAINKALDSKLPRFDPEMRALYEEFYSFPAAVQRLEQILL